MPTRRSVDPLTLLYPESQFAGVGEFAGMHVEAAPQEDDLSSGPRPLFKIWDGTAPTVVESVWVHDDANDAARYVIEYEPRQFTLRLLGPDYLVGEWMSYPAPGAPDSSSLYCDTLHAADLTECDAWKWWARYGQYTFEISAGIGPSDRTIELAQFKQIIDIAASHIAQVLRSRNG